MRTGWRAPPDSLTGGGRDIFVEFVRQGNAVKVTAIDSATGLEASIVGPATAPQNVLAEAARRKLDYLRNRNK